MAQLNWKMFSSGVIRIFESYLRKPQTNLTSPNNFKLLLCGGTLSTTSSLNDILASELTTGNGYTRKTITFNEYSLVGTVLTWTSPYSEFIPNTESWQFDHVVLLSDASDSSNKTVESMSSATNEITVTGHGLSLNDRVMFTVSASAGINLSQLYYAIPTGANTFKISSSVNGAEIDLTTNNSGGGILHYANGDLFLIASYDSLQTGLISVPREINVEFGVTWPT